MAPATVCFKMWHAHAGLLLSHTGRVTKPKTMLSKISQTWTNTTSSLCVESKCAHRREQKGKAFGERKRAENGREARAVGDENKREWYLYMKGHDEAHYFVCWLETQKTSKTSNLENPQNLRCRQAKSPTWPCFISLPLLLLRLFFIIFSILNFCFHSGKICSRFSSFHFCFFQESFSVVLNGFSLPCCHSSKIQNDSFSGRHWKCRSLHGIAG